MQIKTFNYSEKEISTMVSDPSGYLWIGFKQDTSSNCAFQKVSASNPLQKYFDIDLSVTEIKKGFIFSSYIYVALSDSTLIGQRFSLLNPLTTNNTFLLPSGITEAPVDILAHGSYVYFLIPGNTSGTNAKICVFELDGTYSETIDLTTITNAKSFTINTTTSEIWVITYSSPAKYVRVYQLSGNIWAYTVHL